MLNKEELLIQYRQVTSEFLVTLNPSLSKGEKAKRINSKLKKLCQDSIKEILKNDNAEERLHNVLLTTYAIDIVMLEFRNKVWEYEYMAFSRRIGEIWEPFCKIPFQYPINELTLYKPPLFCDIKDGLKDEVFQYIGNLELHSHEKEELLKYYETVWSFIDSGSINLELDLHFIQNDIFYDVDYKSGFNSNEKGNTNRLLLVSSIYHSLPNTHKNLIFVRQDEDQNNHYLQTLKHSPFWEVYCANKAYEKIEEFSGFDLKQWMAHNMDWENDISSDFRNFLNQNDLLKYLTW